MTYAEFCNQVVPLITEIEAECRKMTEQEFKDFRAEAIDRIQKGELTQRFFTAVLDMMQRRVFTGIE